MKKNFIEAGKIIKDAIAGDLQARGILKAHAMGQASVFTESYSTSDLANVFEIATNEKAISQYAEMPRVWDKIAKRNTFSDFNEQKLVEFNWDDALQVSEHAGERVIKGALARIPEGTEYPTLGFSRSAQSFALHKHGARMPFLWEMVVNDQWNILASLPQHLLDFARNTEEVEVITQLVARDGSGVNTDVFKGVAAPDDKPLTIDNLRAALQEVASRKVNGRYVNVNKTSLVVPTTLKYVAEDILSTRQWEETVDGKTFVRNANYGNIELVVSDVMLDINTAANAGTTWFLTPYGGSDGTRDSIINNFLEGHESPEIRTNGNTGNYLGGGAVPYQQGNFLNDSLEYRIRHVVTGGVVHNDALYASTGDA